MKTLTCLILLVANFVFAGVEYTSLNGTTGNILASTTNNYGSSVTMVVGNSTSLTIGVGFTCNGTNGVAVPFNFSKSVDGQNWQSGFLTWNITATGTTNVFATTNLTSLTDVYMVRLDSNWNINTNTASTVTNLYLVGLTKPPSP